MRIVVTGSNGMLATDLARELSPHHEVIGLARADCDIADAAACSSRIAALRPDDVVNDAAMTNVDACESSEEAAFRVNATGAGNVAAAARDAGALVVHFSTDYVFDGRKPEPYVEEDPPNPQ